MSENQGVHYFDTLLSTQQPELDQIIDHETDAVMKERVATSTRGGYDSRNVTFMIWLFDGGLKYAHILEPNIINKMNSREVGGSDHGRMLELMNKMDSVLETLATRSTLLDMDPDSQNDIVQFDLHDEEEDIVLPFLPDDGPAHQAAVCVQTKRQLSERKYTIGYHHGKMNPLPSTWKYPRGITLIHLINLWLIGDKEQNVPPLGKVSTQWVQHFDNNARNYSKMKQVMSFVEGFGRQRGVWVQSNPRWDGKAVTILWSAIWEDFSPYMTTKTISSSSSNVSLDGQPANNSISYHKSRNGQVAVRSIYNKLVSDRKLAGNKPRKRKGIN